MRLVDHLQHVSRRFHLSLRFHEVATKNTSGLRPPSYARRWVASRIPALPTR